MIALVTSTIFVENAYSFFSNEERFEQTQHTIRKLNEAGFERIYLFDNSSTDFDVTKLTLLSDRLSVFHNQQYTFKNKGLNEALLILNNIKYLPDDKTIFKISGRYYPSSKFNFLDYESLPTADISGVANELNSQVPTLNTRAYIAKDKKVLEQYMVWAVEEMLSYSKGIYGLRSLINTLKNYSKSQIGTNYQISLEQAMGRIIKAKMSFNLLNKMNIEGYVAGSDFKEFISE